MENKAKVSLSDKKVYWQNLIREWEESGMSQAAFCRTRNITHSNVFVWRRRLAAESTPCHLYLYRAVDSKGSTLDWMLSRYLNKKAAKKFFKKILTNDYCSVPRVINVDKAKAYPPAFAEAQAKNIIPMETKFRQQKYLNNIQEQDVCHELLAIAA